LGRLFLLMQAAEEYTIVSELLKKAELLTEYEPAGRAVTYNNFACFSRQHGRLHASLSYLLKALRIEEKLDRVDNPADTHLNLCAVLSQLTRHKEALEHCQAALALLQEELFGGSSLASSAQKPDRIAVLAICYHNIGVECEFLKHYQASLQAYTKGVEVATVYLGHDHGITQTLMRSQESARVSIARFPVRRPALAKPAAPPPSAGTHAYASAPGAKRSPRAGAGFADEGIAPTGSSRRKPTPGSSPSLPSPTSPSSASKTGAQPSFPEENSYKKYSESPLRAAAMASLT
jgi:tetratricopeptide (TPR) repeat protein